MVVQQVGTPARRSGRPAENREGTNRTRVSLRALQVAGVVAEAMVSLTPMKAGVQGAASATYVVPAGKRLRLEQILVGIRPNAAAVAELRLRLRVDPAGGSVTTANGTEVPIQVSGAAAVINVGDQLAIPLPEGFEYGPGESIGLSQVATATSTIFDVAILGFEYTP